MKVSKILGGIAAAGCIALAFLIVFAGFKANGADATPSKSSVVDLTGSWHQDPTDATPVNMTAQVLPNHIQIMLASDATNGLYWDGTFDTSPYNSNSFKLTSTSDETALSQDQFKTFTYKNGVISYEFSMLGKNYTVHLIQGE